MSIQKNSLAGGNEARRQKKNLAAASRCFFSFFSTPSLSFLSLSLPTQRITQQASTSNLLLRLLVAVALIVAASARGNSPRPAPAPAPSSSRAAAAAAPAPAPAAPKNVAVSWGFPHAPRPRLSLAPGDTLTFSWDQLHGVYSLGKFAELPAAAAAAAPANNNNNKSNNKDNKAPPPPPPAAEPKCEDFKNFRDAKDFLTVEPRREGYYGPQHGSVSWVAPEEEGVYAFADPIEQNCWAGMLLVVDVERPKAVVAAAAPAPAPSSKAGKKGDEKKPAATAAVVPPAAAPAPAASAAAVSVASVDKAPEPVSPAQQAASASAAAAAAVAAEKTSFVEGETSRSEVAALETPTTPRERHAARVAEREAEREQRRMERAIEEGRVDFEEGAGAGQQHVIED